MPEIRMIVTDEAASFNLGEIEVGRYILDDPFKPYIHPLRSPAGHTASLAIPHDHRHHKGLMYALATDEVNFWEEVPSERFPRIGRQRPESIEISDEGLAEIRQILIWSALDGDYETFREERVLRCSAPTSNTIQWNWSTTLLALRDVNLRHSEWPSVTEDGRPVNYHGLGLRLPRSFGGMSTKTHISLDDQLSTFETALGSEPSSITISDQIDGTWPPPVVAVRMEQLTTSDAFFAMRDPFTYLSVGPSIRSPRAIQQGMSIGGSYQIHITDVIDGSA